MGGSGGVSNENTGVPAFSRKVVQSLKEIVNCSDLEIYEMLVECDMDPNEAVSRLLSQDTFHEVKRKRDKKKETKNLAESWKRSIPNRGARMSSSSSYNTTQGGGNRFKFNDAGSVQGVTTNRRENGTHNHWNGSSSTPGVLGRKPPPNVDSRNAAVKKVPPTNSSDGVYLSSMPSPSYQSDWVNANLGKRTIADIVKMGRPLHQNNAVLPRSSETQESGSKAPLKDKEWPSIENEPQHLDEPHLDEEIPMMKTNLVVSPPYADKFPSASVSSTNLLDDDSRDSLLYEDENNKAAPHSSGESRGEDVYAYSAPGFQKLTIRNEEDHKTLEKGDKPLVIIPNHLQVHTSECSHLMFGSFSLGLGFGQACSDLSDNLEKIKEMDNSSFKHPDTDFNREEEEKLRNVDVNEQTSSQNDSAARNYHDSADSESETTQDEPAPQKDHQYEFSSHGDLNPPSETHPYMHNLDNFPNTMQCYSSSLSNNLLPSGIQDAREPDLQYSPFPTNYSNATASSLSGPEISMAEAIMPGAGQQVTALAQHLTLNPYSHQHGMALGHYGNLISYTFMPPSHNPYIPSTFQQDFHAGKYQATAPTVPPPSAYGFGGGSSSRNNLPLNPINAPNSYEDVLSSQFKDNNHLALSLYQQNENLALWGRQANLRVVPGGGYYIITGHQNQQPPGFYQAQLLPQQQPSQQQHFGEHGYASPYHSQAEISLDHFHHEEQQNTTNASKQTQQ